MGLLWTAVAFAAAQFLACLFHVNFRGVGHLDRAWKLGLAASFFATSAWAILAWGFYAGHANLAAVHEATHAGAPGMPRLAAAWIHPSSVQLALAAGSAIAFSVVARPRRPTDPDRDAARDAVRGWALTFGSLCVLALGVSAILLAPFRATDARLLAAEPGGLGLVTRGLSGMGALQGLTSMTALVAATPLWALSMVPFVTGTHDWTGRALGWARFALVSAWMSLGLWVLGDWKSRTPGSVWSWTPHQAAELASVLVLAVALHGLVYLPKRGLFARMAPAACFLALPTMLLLQSLWVARSGQSLSGEPAVGSAAIVARFLEVLDSEPRVRVLVGVATFLASSGLAIRGWSVGRGPGAPGTARRWLATAAVFTAGFTGALAVWDPRLLWGLLFEVGDMVAPGFSAWAVLLPLVAFIWMFSSAPSPGPASAPGSSVARWLTMGHLVFLGMAVLLMGGVWVVSAFLVEGGPGTSVAVRGGGALLIAGLLLILGVAFTNQAWGRRMSLALGGAAVAIGFLGAFSFPSAREFAFLFPLLGFALCGAFTKAFKANDPGPAAGLDVRIAGGVLLALGFATLAYWAHPPQRTSWLVVDVESSPSWQLAGLAAGAFALVGAVSLLTRSHHGLAFVGAVAAIMFPVFLIGTWGAAAVVAVLVRSDARGLTRWGPEGVVSAFGLMRRGLRKTSIYGIHVALVLGLAGVLWAESTVEQEVLLLGESGQTPGPGGFFYELEEGGVRGLDPASQQADEIWMVVRVTRDGSVFGTIPLGMPLERPEHYGASSASVSVGMSELLLRPVFADISGAQGFVRAVSHEDGIRVLPGSTVDGARILVTHDPGIPLVWAGSLLGAGFAVAAWALASAGRRDEPRDGRGSATPK